ncbi:hypothetical protein VM98_33555, partial [Streptomyces rubellomurinus subsp. indigoferus]
RRGFRAAVAFDGDTVVGMAYGYPLSAKTVWWVTVIAPVPEDLRHEDVTVTFSLCELAVRPQWRLQCVTTLMHRFLIEGIDNALVLLNPRPEATAAQASYRGWVYRRFGSAIPWAGSARHDVMVLDLTGPESRAS